MPTREMLINYVPGEECRIALTVDGKLEEFYHERASTESHVSNIYQGVVTNVEPSIQAAFVDFGLERNGFLHVTDVHPKYFPGADKDETEKIGKKTSRFERPPIEKCFKRGSKVMVQVLKEGIGTKGPTVTSYCSIPGRFLVMMPDMERHGVSRKTQDEDARKEMRDILKTLDPPEGFGFIVRTAGLGQTKTDLKRDMAYLLRLWKDIEKKQKSIRKKTGELYTESDLVIRTIRDVFTSDIDAVILDEPSAAQRAHEFLAVANPRTKSKVILYQDPVPLFHRFGVEPQIDTIGARTVQLPSGGALVIDPTEALVAIDVNSGKSRKAKDAESNAYQTNQEAVDEIARQLRLRDQGGLVVLDLIDMMQAKHRKAIEQRFRNHLKNDRARTRVGSISQFGMLEMTRQRMRPSLKKTIFQECPHCAGEGYSKSPESVVLHVMRQLALVMHRKDIERIELTISPDVAFQILNRKRSELSSLERQYDKTVTVRVGGGTIDYVHIAGFNKTATEIPGDLLTAQKNISKPTDTTFRELSRAEIADLIDDLEAEEQAAQEEERKAQAAKIDDALKPTPRPKNTDDQAPSQVQDDAKPESESDSDDDETTGKKKRRRRRGGRNRSRKTTAPQDGDDLASNQDASNDEKSGPQADAQEQLPGGDEAPDAPANTQASDENPDAPKKKRRRGRRRSKSAGPQASGENNHDGDTPRNDAPDAPNNESTSDASTQVVITDAADAPPKKKRRRRRRSKKTTDGSNDSTENNSDSSASNNDSAGSGYSNSVIEAGV